MNRTTTIKLPALDISLSANPTTSLRGRGRSSSIVKVEEVGNRSVEEVLDRSTYVNANADWVNAKGVCVSNSTQVSKSQRIVNSFTGAWLIHVVLITLGKIFIDTIPGMTQQVSWTLVHLFYLAVREVLVWSASL
jgi:hypothetical protein